MADIDQDHEYGSKHKSKRKTKRGKSLVRMIVESVYCLGFSILGLTGIILAFLAINAEKNILTPIQYQTVIDFIVIGYAVIVISLTILIPFVVTGKIKKKGISILEVANRIKSQDLDFTIIPSGIKEIDLVLSSMDEMRIALKESLETEWRMEQNRKEQISALAHDFKTPVTILKGNLELLQSTRQEEQNAEYLKDAKGSLMQMELYFEQLQDMTRVEKSYLMCREKEELGLIVRGVLAPLSGLAKQKGIKIKFEMKENDIFIFADKVLMERVIQNLVTNSLDFTPPQGVIYVNLETEGDNVLITITDTGPGFGKNALKHGTEQFFMDDTSRGRKNHYGLGLYIANSIVKLHDGSMMLMNDEENGGAKVILKLPLIKE